MAKISKNLSCPRCGSSDRRRDGLVEWRGGADSGLTAPPGPLAKKLQRWICKNCGRAYVDYYRQAPVSADHRAIAARLLALKVAPGVVAAGIQVSRPWIYGYRKKLIKKYGESLAGVIPAGGNNVRG